MSQKYCEVKTNYTAAYPDPLKYKKGDIVELKAKESEWKGWIWCKNKEGQERWVPRSYLEIQGEVAQFNQDYDATELSVSIGEKLVIEKEESGWFWVSNKEKKKGWVPKENVRVLDD
jgi:hypothetical protein